MQQFPPWVPGESCKCLDAETQHALTPELAPSVTQRTQGKRAMSYAWCNTSLLHCTTHTCGEETFELHLG